MRAAYVRQRTTHTTVVEMQKIGRAYAGAFASSSIVFETRLPSAGSWVDRDSVTLFTTFRFPSRSRSVEAPAREKKDAQLDSR
jgi:hypothetical protein